MKIGGITWERPSGGRLLRLGGYLAAGFLSVACSLEGRAPLAAGFLAACRPGKNALTALCGAVLGSFAFLGFGSALRCCGILVLESAVLSAFRDTVWFQHPLFRPLTADGAKLAVALAEAAAAAGLYRPGGASGPLLRPAAAADLYSPAASSLPGAGGPAGPAEALRRCPAVPL